MHGRRWEQIAAATGIGFIALLIAGFAVMGETPGDEASAQEWLAYYLDGGNRDQIFWGSLLLGLAGLLFLWFLGSLRSALRRAEGEPGRLSAVAFGGGLVFSGLYFASGAASLAVPGAIEFFDNFQLDPHAAMLLQSLSFAFFTVASSSLAVLVGATAVLAIRTRVFPTWLAWASVVAALAGLVSFLFFPFFAVLAWVLAVSILLTVRAGRVQPVGAG